VYIQREYLECFCADFKIKCSKAENSTYDFGSQPAYAWLCSPLAHEQHSGTLLEQHSAWESIDGSEYQLVRSCPWKTYQLSPTIWNSCDHSVEVALSWNILWGEADAVPLEFRCCFKQNLLKNLHWTSRENGNDMSRGIQEHMENPIGQ